GPAVASRPAAATRAVTVIVGRIKLFLGDLGTLFRSPFRDLRGKGKREMVANQPLSLSGPALRGSPQGWAGRSGVYRQALSSGRRSLPDSLLASSANWAVSAAWSRSWAAQVRSSSKNTLSPIACRIACRVIAPRV